MIQRVQTLLLVIFVTLMISLFFVPIFIKHDLVTNERVVMTALNTQVTKDDKVINTQATFVIAIIAGLAIVASTFSIFQYNNRKNQMLVGLLNTLLVLGMLGAMIYYSSEANKLVVAKVVGKFGFGFFVPAIGLILNMIANRFIRRDERLVKDAFDRIR